MASPRILLVEDDERLAELTAEYLRKNDFEVAIEPRGDTACTRIPAEIPDLVVLDVMLPGKDGFEVCRSVRPTYAGVILMDGRPHILKAVLSAAVFGLVLFLWRCRCLGHRR